MATKGTYSALNQVRRTDLGLDDMIVRNERNQFLYRDEERKKQEAETDRIKELSDSWGLTQDNLTQKITGVKSIDQGIAEGIMKARDMSLDAYKRVEKNPNDVEARMVIKNLDNYASNLEQFTNKYTNYTADLAKGIAEGKYDKTLNKGIADNLNNIYKDANFVFGVDKMGLPVMAVKQEDGRLKATGFEQIFDGTGLEKPIMKANSDNWSTDKAKQFGNIKTKTSEDGFRTKEYTGFDFKKLPDLKTDIDNYLGTDISKVSNEAKSLWVSELGRDINSLDSEGLDELKDYLTQKVINTYKTEDSETIDFGSKNAATRLNLDRQKYDDEKSESMSEIEVDRDSDGSLLETTLPSGEKAFSFSPPKPIQAGTKDQPVEINKLFVDSDGDFSFSGRVKTGERTIRDEDTGETLKEPVYEKIPLQKVDGKDLNSISRLIKNPETNKSFKDQSELVNFLQGKVTDNNNGKEKVLW
ncbi:hypothetical protein [Galbibacter sp. BG1]